MKRHMHRLSVLLLTLATLLVTAPKLWAAPFSQTKIIIEVNATDGDAGIQVFLDGTGWKSLQVFDPNGLKVLDISADANGSIGMQGLTELFFESAEPSFDEQTLEQLFARFPEGNYTFVGITVNDAKLTGKATLKHNIPDGPVIVSPAEGGPALNPNAPVVIDWDPVTNSFPGTALPVNVVAYQVIVERVKPQPLRVFSVDLTATVTQVTVPLEFLQGNAEYAFEVLAIEASGNQTISHGAFVTQ
jgi:hypothetical protein